MIFGILTKALEIRCSVIKAYFVDSDMGLKIMMKQPKDQLTLYNIYVCYLTNISVLVLLQNLLKVKSQIRPNEPG